jgi:hypothetical protein
VIVPMVQNWRALSAGLALTALSLGACAGDGASRSGAQVRGDAPGEVVLPGKVRIARIDRQPAGRVTYYLENIAGSLQEDLSYHIDFLYKPVVGSAIEIREDRNTTPERDLVLLKGDAAKQCAADNPRPGVEYITTQISVSESPPIAVVARDASNRGTLFLNGALECVGMSSEDDIRAGTLWIEVENNSNRPVSELEAKAAFVDQMVGTKHAETKWTPVKDLRGEGDRARIEFNLAGLGKVSQYTVLVKIRQQSL